MERNVARRKNGMAWATPLGNENLFDHICNYNLVA